MAQLSRQRCLSHPEREAVARCPECEQYHCRECVIEHEGRMLCAGCLSKEGAEETKKRFHLAPIGRLAAAAFGFFIIWSLFHFAGSMLIRIPDEFHDGTVFDSNQYE